MRIFNQFDVAFSPIFIFDPSDLKAPFDFLKKIKMIPSRYGANISKNTLEPNSDFMKFESLLFNPDLAQCIENDEIEKLAAEYEIPDSFYCGDLADDVFEKIKQAVIKNKTTSFDKLFGTEELIDKNLNNPLNRISTIDDYDFDSDDDDSDDDVDDVVAGFNSPTLDFCAVNGAFNGKPNKLQTLKGMNIGLNAHDLIRLRHVFENRISFATAPFLLKKKYLIKYLFHGKQGYVLPDSFEGSVDCLSFEDNHYDPDDECHYGFEGNMGDLINKEFTEEEQKDLTFLRVAGVYTCDADFEETEEERIRRLTEPRKFDDKANIVSIQILESDMPDQEYLKLVNKVVKFMHEIAYTTNLSSMGINSKDVSNGRPFAMFSYLESIVGGYRYNH